MTFEKLPHVKYYPKFKTHKFTYKGVHVETGWHEGRQCLCADLCTPTGKGRMIFGSTVKILIAGVRLACAKGPTDIFWDVPLMAELEPQNGRGLDIDGTLVDFEKEHHKPFNRSGGNK